MKSRDLTAQISALFAARGVLCYGEGVSQRAHALQAAALAERSGCDSAMVTAALLHDIGHLLDKRGEEAAARGIDTKHEVIGAGWLARHFGEPVCEPIRLHVAAKRYLCAVEPGYYERLSSASKLSISLQGGPMTEAEAAAFVAQPYAAEAVQLRRWDEAAKRPEAVTPGFEHFARHIQAAMAA